MRILVTGGAGYVGSVLVEELLKQDYEVVILDNLQQGHKECIPENAEIVLADCGDIQALDNVFNHFRIAAVMHMAADSIVSISATNPQRFFRNNVVGGINLLDAMLKHDIKNFIFSSSAAVYGEPEFIPIKEDNLLMPVNAYGETKLIFEKILKWYGKAYGLKSISLRYFNAAGASKRLGEDHHPETHLIPNILKAALMGDAGAPVTIFGTDYPTKDGSCIRDYVNVVDIAQAHVKALQRINELTGRAFNLGNGNGYSVLEVIDAAERICGRQIPKVISTRREGDPAVLVASCVKAKQELGWEPQYSELGVIVEGAWQWLLTHPHGYGN